VIRRERHLDQRLRSQAHCTAGAGRDFGLFGVLWTAQTRQHKKELGFRGNWRKRDTPIELDLDFLRGDVLLSCGLQLGVFWVGMGGARGPIPAIY